MHLVFELLCLALSAHAAAAQAPSGCRGPTMPPGATLDIKFLNREQFGPGESVDFQCAEDAAAAPGGSRSATCDGGRWTQLTCEQTTCGDPGNLPNGRFEYDGNAVNGDLVYAKCNDGYTLKGMNYRTCQHSGWTGDFPTCEEVTCSKPSILLNHYSTVITGLKPSYRPRDSLSFSCNEHYILNGSAASTCGPDGNWSPPFPKCRRGKCPVLQIPHGKLSTKHRRVGSKITVSCDPEFHRMGPTTVVCSEKETWSEIPNCLSEKEAETPCPSPAVLNAEQSGGDALVHSRGHSVTFTCKQGFQLTGSPQVTCGPGGQWQPQLPRCLPSSGNTQESPDKQGGCATPIGGAHVHLDDRYITMKHFASGDQVVYACDIGYIPAGGSRFRKCSDGKWSPLLLECKRKSCGSAGEISNGEFMYTGAEFGDTASAVCNDGYELVGQGTRICMNGGWNGHIPSCEVIHCPVPPEVKNADRTSSLSGSYKYKIIVGYHCRVGTLVGQSQIWCTKDGTWSSPPPQCKEVTADVTCPFPNVPNSSRRGALNPPFKYRSSVLFQCHSRYRMVGNRSVTCGLDGHWTPSLPKCIWHGRY